MAGEVRGRVCEALIVKALREIEFPEVYRGLVVVWDEQVPNLPIRPDVTLRDKVGNIHALIQVTYSGSETHEREKYWRDFAELSDFRLKFSCPVIYVTYLSARRIKIGKATIATRNASLTLIDLPNGEELLQIIADVVKALPKDTSRDNILQLVERCLSSNRYSQGFDALKFEIKQKLEKGDNKEVASFWNSVKLIAGRKVPSTRCKSTYIRRGIALLTILPSEYRNLIYENVEKGSELPVGPSYGVSCEIIQNIGQNAKIINPAVLDAINRLGGSTIEDIIKADNKKREHYVQQIRNLDFFDEEIFWLVQHYEELTDSHSLAKLLQQCFDGKLNCIPQLSGSSPNCWLYSSIKYVIGKFLGKQGTGWILDVVSQTGKRRSELVGFDFPKFERLEEPLSEEVCNAVAVALAKRLNQIQPSGIVPKVLEITESARKHLIGNNLMSNGIDPVGILIQLVLDKKAKSKRLPSAISTWLRETGRERAFDTNTLATQGYLIHNTFLHWKSSYEGHPTDKTKELCGRANHIRVNWDNQTQQFKQREEISRYILVLDGNWTQLQIDRLYSAGWDYILYPDELNELPSLIV